MRISRAASPRRELRVSLHYRCSTLFHGQLPGPRFDRFSLDNIDLSGSNFAGYNLTNASMGGTLLNANFSQAILTKAFLGYILTGANLTGAEVRGAFFQVSRQRNSIQQPAIWPTI